MLALLANVALYIVPFLAVITVIVTIHELGHFLVARACGIAVDRFSVGFGKTMFAIRDRWGVEWRVAWLPLGGYVRFAGDENAASVPDEEDLDSLRARIVRKEGPGAERKYFAFKPLWQRALVVVAGPASNFLLAIALFAALFAFVGEGVTQGPISFVQPGSAAARAGFHAGDQIVAADGHAMPGFEDLHRYVIYRGGVPIDFSVRRGGQLIHLEATPSTQLIDSGFGGKEPAGLLGVMGPRTAPKFVRYGPVTAIGKGAERTWETVQTTGFFVGRIIDGAVSPTQLHGTIGTVTLTGTVTKEAIDDAKGDPAIQALGVLVGLVNLCALVSVSVGLVNLLPIPILDGGHLLFYAYEFVVRRPLSASVQAAGYRVGLALLVGLMLFANVNDLHLQKVFHFFGALFS